MGARHYMGAHLNANAGRSVQQFGHPFAGFGQIKAQFARHMHQPAFGIGALAVAGGVIHHRNHPRQRALDQRLGQGYSVGVAYFAAQMQQVIGAKQVFFLPLL